MPYKDIAQQREYQRKRMARRRVEFFFGKQCVKCGSTLNLQLDHIDRTKKTSHRIWSWSSPRFSNEVSKCQILCCTCHRQKSNDECRVLFSLPITHGTETGYNERDCRCNLCREARRIARHKRSH